jgi:adenylate cyclase
MASPQTVVFADLTGSTAAFEQLGNARATQLVTSLTNWVGQVCDLHGGRVVKLLGDGVLALFPAAPAAVAAVVQMQREHVARLNDWPEPIRMRLQVGVASGELVEVDGDCYGDAVNVAARLSDLSGPDQIWATRAVIAECAAPPPGARFLSLGGVPIRGKTGTLATFRIEWQEDVQTVNLTEPAALLPADFAGAQAAGDSIRLSWLDQRSAFGSGDLPVQLGRDDEAQFSVKDPRVSRIHARIEWRGGAFVLTDLSSYGTWVRFAGQPTELALRRDQCVLLGSGEIALGAPFDDFTVPTVAFDIERPA